MVSTVESSPLQNAGTGGYECDLNATLPAAPSIGTGTWTMQSGPGTPTFDNVTDPNSGVTVDTYGSYVFEWMELNGVCTASTDIVNFDFYAPHTASAGTDDAVCNDGSPIITSGSVGGSASSSAWSTSGDGSFVDNTVAIATYIPGTTDAINGSVTLTITTAGVCPSANDDVIFTLDQEPVANAGADFDLCSNGGDAFLSGSASGSATALTWSGGDGTFMDNTVGNTQYTPGTGDIGAGFVTLTITTDNPNTCPADADQVIITIHPGAEVDAGSDFSITESDDAYLSATFGGSASSASWNSYGDGTFDDNSSSYAAIHTATNGCQQRFGNTEISTDDPAGIGLPVG